jgi:hypothetical protein
MAKADENKALRQLDDARAEVTALRAALTKIQREASRRFEGKGCARCSVIEVLATTALERPKQPMTKAIDAEDDKTGKISLSQQQKLLARKKKIE